HGNMVYRLYFLSDLSVQTDAEIFQILTEYIWRKDRKKSAGLSFFVCGMVYDRDLARRELEFYCLGTDELCRHHDLGGTGAAVPEVPRPLSCEGQSVVRRI